tara:strand:+ start:283 stop:429 length:147 start_codon:yes stop_codon:yes gene_type:complete
MATRVNRYVSDLDLEVVPEALRQELCNMFAVDITAMKLCSKHFQISGE